MLSVPLSSFSQLLSRLQRYNIFSNSQNDLPKNFLNFLVPPLLLPFHSHLARVLMLSNNAHSRTCSQRDSDRVSIRPTTACDFLALCFADSKKLRIFAVTNKS